jgi:hypothetical protein
LSPQTPIPSPACAVPRLRRLNLRLTSKLDAAARRVIREVTGRLPDLFGGPIFVSTRPHLKAYRGSLLSGRHERGMPVHAASFIRHREIILETQLLAHPRKLRMIMAHEIFHFVWARLGNQRRAEFAGLVIAEIEANARGEMGESAGSWKRGDLKNYICESFCDTAAWLYSGVKRSPEFTLAARWREKRRAWFQSTFGTAKARTC